MGIRLDSGDLAYLSKESRKYFISIADQYNIGYFQNFTIDYPMLIEVYCIE